MNPDTPILDRLQAMPKAEVHVHLEGCFDAALLEQCAHKFGKRLPRRRERLFHFEGLADGPACDFGGDNPSPTLMVPKSFRLPAAIGAARLCCP